MNDSDIRTNTTPETPRRLSQAVRWFREKVSTKHEGTVKDMLEEALDEVLIEDTTISAEEKSLLKNMIHFGELTVKDVMIPRSDILGINRETTPEELKEHVITIGHTRIPVFEDSLDTIEGFIHVKDLFPYLVSGDSFKLNQVIREILFVPPSMRIVDLLMKMRSSACHIAIVVDEFGGTDGLVTMEDLFEELVGEIQDEHDEHEGTPSVHKIGDHIFEADARVSIPEINTALGDSLTENASLLDAVDTIGGFIIQHLGRVPVRGEVVLLKPTLKVEITAADPRRIRQVRLTKIQAAPSN